MFTVFRIDQTLGLHGMVFGYPEFGVIFPQVVPQKCQNGQTTVEQTQRVCDVQIESILQCPFNDTSHDVWRSVLLLYLYSINVRRTAIRCAVCGVRGATTETPMELADWMKYRWMWRHPQSVFSLIKCASNRFLFHSNNYLNGVVGKPKSIHIRRSSFNICDMCGW